MNICIVLPSFNCEQTLKDTYESIPVEYRKSLVFVDDKSMDNSVAVARQLGIPVVITRDKNEGYGANQKTCYNYALQSGADVVIMLHPDNQYDATLIPQIVEEFNKGHQVVFVSRFKSPRFVLDNGMPIYKFVCNRMLTIFQNMLCGQHLTEYHTGYRAYTADVLRKIDYNHLSNDFIFDNEFILEAFRNGFAIAEIFGAGRYEATSSSINLWRSIKYGCLIVHNTIVYCCRRR